MSVFSQFISGGGSGSGGSPVGSVMMMPDSTSTDLFTTNGQTFLRTGKLETYSAAYSNAVTNGQAYTKWATSVDNNSSAIPYPHRAVANQTTAGASAFSPYMTFALGVWGKMTPITQNSEYIPQTVTSPQTYVFSAGSTGLRNPVILRLPPRQAVINTASATTASYVFLDRTAPTYLSGPKLWSFVEMEQAYGTSSVIGQVLGFRIYLSKSGSQWRSLFLPANNPITIDTGSYEISAASSANNIFVTAYSQSQAGSNIYQIGVGANGSSVNLVGIGLIAPDTNTSLFTVSATEVLFEYNTAQPARVFCALTDNSSVNALNNGPDYIVTSTSSFCFTRNDTTMVFFATYGPIVKVGTSLAATLRSTAKTVSNATPLTTSGSNLLTATWTGSYFVIWTDSSTASSYQPYYSTDGNSWTAVSNTYSSLSINPSIEPSSTLKDHVYLNRTATTWNIWSFATNNIITAPNNASGLEQPIKEYVTFNSALYAIQRNSYVSKTNSNLVTSELSTYTTTTTGATFSSGAKLKVVNGYMFVVNTSNNFLFYTSDGTNWTSVSISTISRIIDIEYIGTNWVVVGIGGTANSAYSANLSTWTGINIVGAAGNTIYGVLNTGTALVAFSDTGMRRSTDGVTWNTVTGSFTATAGLSMFYNSTTSTAYAYQAYSASIGSYRYVSTDAGLTWTGALISSSLVSLNNLDTSTIPFGFKQFNGKNYCVYGYPNTGNNGSIPNGRIVATTTDFLNFTQVSLPLPMGSISSICSLDSNILMAIGGFEMFPTTGVAQGSLSMPPMVQVVEAVGTASFVGTDIEIQQDGGVGYLRIA